MKSDKAEDYLINHECGYPMDGYVPLMEAGRAVEIAELDSEERMRAKAIVAFCAANCPKGCSFGTGGGIGCAAKYRFIQKLKDDETD